jgi:hypothetical protein
MTASRNSFAAGRCRSAFLQKSVLSRQHARWGPPYFQQFFDAMPGKPPSLAPLPCLPRIKNLVVAAIKERHCARALRAARSH